MPKVKGQFIPQFIEYWEDFSTKEEMAEIKRLLVLVDNLSEEINILRKQQITIYKTCSSRAKRKGKDRKTWQKYASKKQLAMYDDLCKTVFSLKIERIKLTKKYQLIRSRCWNRRKRFLDKISKKPLGDPKLKVLKSVVNY